MQSSQPAAPFPAPKRASFSFIDLFAGVGGFRMAMQRLGGRCAFSSEWNLKAQQTYQANYGDAPFGDITHPDTKAHIPAQFDILCGGFPCQAFSIAGHRKGFQETRGTLFFEVAEIARKHRPKAIFLENVKNLLTHDNGNTLQVICNTLQELGYHVSHQVLNSMTHANVPQNRARIFIVAFDPIQVPCYREFSFPEAIPLSSTIHDFLEKGPVQAKYYYPPEHRHYAKMAEGVVSRDTLYQWRRVYVRENKRKVCPTLTANMGSGGHNVPLVKDAYGIRKLTPKECFAFQGYPVDQMRFPAKMANSSLYIQAGNSVTMPLIQRIGEQILKVLEKQRHKKVG